MTWIKLLLWVFAPDLAAQIQPGTRGELSTAQKKSYELSLVGKKKLYGVFDGVWEFKEKKVLVKCNYSVNSTSIYVFFLFSLFFEMKKTYFSRKINLAQRVFHHPTPHRAIQQQCPLMLLLFIFHWIWINK